MGAAAGMCASRCRFACRRRSHKSRALAATSNARFFLLLLCRLSAPLDLVELLRILDLVPRPLASGGQVHGVSSSPVAADVLQSLDIFPHDLLRVVVYRHVGQLGCQRSDGSGRQAPDLGERVDRVFGEDAHRRGRPQRVEGLEGFLRCKGQSCQLVRGGESRVVGI